MGSIYSSSPKIQAVGKGVAPQCAGLCKHFAPKWMRIYKCRPAQQYLKRCLTQRGTPTETTIQPFWNLHWSKVKAVRVPCRSGACGPLSQRPPSCPQEVQGTADHKPIHQPLLNTGTWVRSTGISSFGARSSADMMQG